MASVFANGHVKRGLQMSVEKQSDAYLIDRFLNCEEFESEDAFTTLAKRHGPMVLGICRHLLKDETDAEDAFQSTFLVLARKAGSIRNRTAVAGWLHEVAYRVARKAHRKEVRRRRSEKQGMVMSPRTIENDDLPETAIWNELRPVLHEEVNRLPEKLRILIVLSYLEGQTNEEVAELQTCPLGTVKGRLSRARALLRERLMRRGMVLPAAFLWTALSRGIVFAELVPNEMINRSVRLVGTLTRRPRLFIPTPSSAQSRVVALADSYREHLGLGYLTYAAFFAILFISIAVGVGLAFGIDASSSSLRTALSAVIRWQATGSSCH
jgi:RNA polymerase sigma factor (sigma-70 family)